MNVYTETMKRTIKPKKMGDASFQKHNQESKLPKPKPPTFKQIIDESKKTNTK